MMKKICFLMGLCLVALNGVFAQSLDSLNLDFEEWELSGRVITNEVLLQYITDQDVNEIPYGSPIRWKVNNRICFRSPESFSGDHSLGITTAGTMHSNIIFALTESDYEDGCPVEFPEINDFPFNFKSCQEFTNPVHAISGYYKKKGTEQALTDTLLLFFEAAIWDTVQQELNIVGRGMHHVPPSDEFERFEFNIVYDTIPGIITHIRFFGYHLHSETRENPAFVEHIDNIQFHLLTTSTSPPIINEKHLKVFPNPTINNTIVNVEILEETTQSRKLYLIDHLGKLIMYKAGTNKRFQINTQNIPNGIYTVLIEDNQNRRVSTKIIIN